MTSAPDSAGGAGGDVMSGPIRMLIAVVITVAANLIPPAVLAQQINTDSLRTAELASVERNARQVGEAVGVFLDRARPEQQRLAAVQRVAIILQPAQLRQSARLVADQQQPLAIRIRALQLAGNATHDDADFGMQVVLLAENRTTPMALRREAMEMIAMMLWTSHAKNTNLSEITRALRTVSRDADPGMRRAALTLLASHRDQQALELLGAGLRNSQAALVPPAEAVRLLGLADPSPHFSVLHDILMRPPDPETHLEAVRLLGAHRPSQPHLVRILQDGSAPPALRQAALSSLAANDARNFPEHVLPVVQDERAPRELRLNAIKTVELLRTSRDSRTIAARQPDVFDRAVERLSEQSADQAVRVGARNYLVRTRAPR